MEQRSLKKAVLKIGGMHCSGCVSSIQQSVLHLRGVEKCEVNLLSEKAVIEYDPEQSGVDSIEDSICKMGYRVIYYDATFVLSGLADLSDAHMLESELDKVDGVKQVSVNYGNSHLSLRYNPEIISLGDLRQKISHLHYTIVSEDLTVSSEHVESANLKKYFLVSLALAIPVILYSYPEVFKIIPFSKSDLAAYIMFGCATIIQFGAGSRFYLGAYRIAKLHSANMDTLVVTGTTAAYLFSATNLFPTPNWQHFAFDASSVVITFILLGKYLENKTKAITSGTIRKLLEIQPRTATVRRDGIEVEVSVDDIRQDEVILVKPGLRVPTDGTVIDGNSSVDESMITGEYLPVRKKVGDSAIGGTINKDGILVIKAVKVGQDTLLSQIVRMVEDSISTKPPIQRLVDLVAGRFAFAVMAVSAVTFFLWLEFGLGNIHLALIPAVSILVVACPCALGLATPTAIMVGVGKGAHNGILFKKSETFEILDKVSVVVFDKTGTLTHGELSVTDVIPLDSTTESQIIVTAASIERYSEHPIGLGIVKNSKEVGVTLYDVCDFLSSPGLGASGKVGENNVLVGSVQFVEQKGVDLEDSKSIIKKIQEESKTVVAVCINLKPVGLIALQDTPRSESGAVVDVLRKKGIWPVMLTGDNEITARAIGAKIG
ncbi:MAG: heavy metal translocating P-type ATPase, partial [Thaumarchaeota archaeon]|nr:heavy metal translocating P-type ATPase [Nitrososphaerota archaeon]